MIVKAIDDVVFWYGLTAFQTGLTVSRAQPEHRTLFQPICDRYSKLAADAKIKADKIVDFFNELSSLIFRDMQENAHLKIRNVIKQGKSTAEILSSDSDLPYTYIAEEIMNITEELSAVPFPEITARLLEDCLFRLDIITFSINMDVWHSSSYQRLLDNINALKEQLRETMEFFQSLPSDVRTVSASEKSSIMEYTLEKNCRNLAFQGNILLFYLKGEIQHLGSRISNESQQTAMDTICTLLNQIIQLAYHTGKETNRTENDVGQLRKSIQDLYTAMTIQAESLGIYGAPIQYIAEEVKQLQINL